MGKKQYNRRKKKNLLMRVITVCFVISAVFIVAALALSRSAGRNRDRTAGQNMRDYINEGEAAFADGNAEIPDVAEPLDPGYTEENTDPAVAGFDVPRGDDTVSPFVEQGGGLFDLYGDDGRPDDMDDENAGKSYPKRENKTDKYIKIEGIEANIGPEVSVNIDDVLEKDTGNNDHAGNTADTRGTGVPARPARVPHPGPLVVACIGDSITAGAGLADIPTQSYPAQLQAMLGPGYQVVNFGVGGSTLFDTGAYPYRTTWAYAPSKEKNADIYVIMLGTNDAKTSYWTATGYTTELTKFVTEYMQLPSIPHIILMSEPKAFTLWGDAVPPDGIYDGIVSQFPPIVKAVSKSMGLTMVDMYSYTKDHPEWYGDAVHLNVEGCRQMAHMVYGAIRVLG